MRPDNDPIRLLIPEGWPSVEALQGALIQQGLSVEVLRARGPEELASALQEHAWDALSTPPQPPSSEPELQRLVVARGELAEQRRRSQRMEVLGRLAGSIAHDFNNVLAAIVGYCEVVRQELSEADPLQEDIGHIANAARRGSELTRQLRTFSRDEVLEPQVVDLNALVRGVERLLGRAIGESVELATQLDRGLGSTLGDPRQLEQILFTLALDARDELPYGGRVTLHTQNVPAERPDDPPEGWVGLTVGGHAARAEGQRAPTRPGEMGLARSTRPGGSWDLSALRGLVRQCEGRLDVQRAPGQFVTFELRLPRMESEQARSGRLEQLAQPTPSGGERVLLVEDEDGLRGLVARMLRRHGYTVLEARHGREALLVHERAEEPVDLLLTDVCMPHMGGAELAERFADQAPSTPILFMSAYADDTVQQQGMLRPGVAFIEKPFSGATLAARIRQLLDTSDPSEERP